MLYVSDRGISGLRSAAKKVGGALKSEASSAVKAAASGAGTSVGDALIRLARGASPGQAAPSSGPDYSSIAPWILGALAAGGAIYVVTRKG